MDTKKFLKDGFVIFVLAWFAFSVAIYLLNGYVYAYGSADQQSFGFLPSISSCQGMPPRQAVQRPSSFVASQLS